MLYCENGSQQMVSRRKGQIFFVGQKNLIILIHWPTSAQPRCGTLEIKGQYRRTPGGEICANAIFKIHLMINHYKSSTYVCDSIHFFCSLISHELKWSLFGHITTKLMRSCFCMFIFWEPCWKKRKKDQFRECALLFALVVTAPLTPTVQFESEMGVLY